jgi:hypothetical protein
MGSAVLRQLKLVDDVEPLVVAPGDYRFGASD